jgi:hypothetical protein
LRELLVSHVTIATSVLINMSHTMKGRYKDDAEEGDSEQQQQQQQKKNAPRKHDDGRFQDCNEHLYQAFQELHGLAQGEFATQCTAAADNAGCCWLLSAAAASTWSQPQLVSSNGLCRGHKLQLTWNVGLPHLSLKFRMSGMTDFEKPFDAPAILVVGHQTDGKSALVEALMVGEYFINQLSGSHTAGLAQQKLLEECSWAGS